MASVTTDVKGDKKKYYTGDGGNRTHVALAASQRRNA